MRRTAREDLYRIARLVVDVEKLMLMDSQSEEYEAKHSQIVAEHSRQEMLQAIAFVIRKGSQR